MYIVKDYSTTPPSQHEYDAIETIVYNDERQTYVPSDTPDGFNAIVIVHISYTEERVVTTPYVFAGHTMKGDEPIGTYEWRDDPEDEEEE